MLGMLPVYKGTQSRSTRGSKCIISWASPFLHNANIPVLGDAELIIGLTASGEAEQGKAKIQPEYMGSIDTNSVRELVEEVLEGGRYAFEMRRLKYGF